MNQQFTNPDRLKILRYSNVVCSCCARNVTDDLLSLIQSVLEEPGSAAFLMLDFEKSASRE